MFELSSTRVSKLCFHLVIDVAVGEVCFMIGMLMRLYIYIYIYIYYIRLVISEACNMWVRYTPVYFVCYIHTSYKERLVSIFRSASLPCRGLLLPGWRAPNMHKLHQCLLFFFSFSQVASMYQDPSIGDIKVYYVVTKIIVLSSTEEEVRISLQWRREDIRTLLLRN